MLSTTSPKRPPKRVIPLEESPTQLGVLQLLHAFLDEKHRAPTFREIASALDISQSGARQAVTRLERRGFVQRSGETRYGDMAITSAGKTWLNAMKRANSSKKAKAA